MLPDCGTHALRLRNREALEVGLAALKDNEGCIPTALYLTYMAFRQRAIEEHNLMDAPPGGTREWADALADARLLERHVSQCWATAILRTYESTT